MKRKRQDLNQERKDLKPRRRLQDERTFKFGKLRGKESEMELDESKKRQNEDETPISQRR